MVFAIKYAIKIAIYIFGDAIQSLMWTVKKVLNKRFLLISVTGISA